MSVFGAEVLFAAFASQRHPFRAFQTRQQAQQPHNQWYTQQFDLAEYRSFASGPTCANGSTARFIETSLGTFIRKQIDPYHFLEKYQDINPVNNEKVIVLKNSRENRDVTLHYTSIALSTGVTTALIYPVTLLGTWQIIQNFGNPSKSIFPFTILYQSYQDAINTIQRISASKKSFYDGVLTTVVSNISFEVLKFAINDKLHKYFDFENIGNQIREKNLEVTEKKNHVEVRQEARRESVNLRLKRLALSSFLNYCSSIISEIVVYPLRTIALKLQAQGAARFPIWYNGGFDCASRVIQEEGVLSLYSGMSSLVISIGPEFLAAGVTYAGFYVFVNAVSDKTREETVENILKVMEGNRFD